MIFARILKKSKSNFCFFKNDFPILGFGVGGIEKILFLFQKYDITALFYATIYMIDDNKLSTKSTTSRAWSAMKLHSHSSNSMGSDMS